MRGGEHRRQPGQLDSIGYGRFTTRTDRDVDYWGVGGEARFGKGAEPVPDSGGYLFRFAYVGVGGDVRGIDQDNKLRLRGDGPSQRDARHHLCGRLPVRRRRIQHSRLSWYGRKLGLTVVAFAARWRVQRR